MPIKTGIVVLLMLSMLAASSQSFNQLTNAEKKTGWTLLFDGKSLAGWHYYKQEPLEAIWKVQDGAIYCAASQQKGKKTEADLCTDSIYENFDLKLQWRISPYGNSGVMFLVQDNPNYEFPYLTGPEMQVLDNEGHPDGKFPKHRAGDLYDLISSSSEPVHAVGAWNDAEIKLDHSKLSLYLNGVLVVSTTLWDQNWDSLVKASKFHSMPDFAKFRTGRIDLQDHGNDVWFRNIKIRVIK